MLDLVKVVCLLQLMGHVLNLKSRGSDIIYINIINGIGIIVNFSSAAICHRLVTSDYGRLLKLIIAVVVVVFTAISTTCLVALLYKKDEMLSGAV